MKRPLRVHLTLLTERVIPVAIRSVESYNHAERDPEKVKQDFK